MTIVVEEVERYAEAFTSPPDELFVRLAAETREKTDSPGMMVGAVEGAFLRFLVAAMRAERVLELGTFTGYSSICMALGGAHVTTCDVNAETNAIAQRYAEEAGVRDRIDYRFGPATETLREIDGPFDLVFIDADKGGYVDYYEATLPKLAPHGLLIGDNALSSGRVVDSNSDSAMTQAIQRFNEHVRSDERVDHVMLTVRDGMLVVRKR